MMRRVLKALKWPTLSLLALVALAGISCIWLLGSQSGNRWLFERVDGLVEARIDVQTFDGTLWQGLRNTTILYAEPQREVRIENLRLDIVWRALWRGRLHVERLDITSVTVLDESPAADPAEALSVAEFESPITISVGSATIGSIELLATDASPDVADVVLSDIQLDDHRLRIAAARAATADIDAELSAAVFRFARPFNLRGELAWAQTVGDWSGSGSVGGSLTTLVLDQRVAGPYPANLTGTLELLDRIEPRFDLTVTFDEWQLNRIRARSGRIDVTGTIDDYGAGLSATLSEPQFGDFAFTADARGSRRGATLNEAALSGELADLIARGDIRWAESLAANLTLDVLEFDPSQLDAELEGRLFATLAIGYAEVTGLKAEIEALGGEFNGQPVTASGTVDELDGVLQCETCFLQVGDNTVALSGSWSPDDIDLIVDTNAPEVAQIWPRLGGALTLAGRVRGPADRPGFAGTLEALAPRFDDCSADRLQLNSPGTTLQMLNISLQVDAAVCGERLLGSLDAEVNGDPAAASFDGRWRLATLEVAAAGQANTLNTTTRIRLERATLEESTVGQWRLNRPATVQIDGTAMSVDPHQWSGDGGALTVKALEVSDVRSRIEADLTGLPLAMLNAFLTEDLSLSGVANASVNLESNNDLWNGSASWEQADTVVTVTLPSQPKTEIQVPLVRADATLVDNELRSTTNLQIEPDVTARLELTTSIAAADPKVDARFVLDGDDWGWLTALVPQVDQLLGSISADIRATGDLRAPDLDGDLNWRDGSLAIPALNVPLTDINASLSGASAGSATLFATASAGNGDLNISGDFSELTSASRRVQLSVSGDGAELINWPEYRLWASPNLMVIGDAEGWNVVGAVTVPRAEIEVRELPEEAVTRSADVRVLGEESVAETPLQFRGDARVVLGEKVSVAAFGLETRLEGEVIVRARPTRDPRLEGKVTLQDGTFRAYGQQLNIDSGTLTFTGDPSNPLVNVRAVRVIETFDGQVTAGIHLRGRAQSLTSTVYADPAMPEADALSYLIIGRPLSQASDTEGNELSGAAVSLGLRQATRITEQIGQALGLDQLSLVGDGGDSTALVVGKQVNRRLHVRYAYGVFSRLGTLLLRYRLSDRLTLEAGSGEAESIDLLYSVEKL